MASWSVIRANTWNNAVTSVQVPSGPDRMLVLLNFMYDTNPQLPTITIDPGGAYEATFNIVTHDNGHNRSRATLACLLEANMPPAGTYDVLFTYSLQTQSQRAIMLIAQGVIQQNPVLVPPTTEEVVNSVSTAIPSPPANYIAIDVVKSELPPGTVSAGAGQTEVYAGLESNNVFYSASHADSLSPLSWSWGLARTSSHVIAYVEYDASAALTLTDVDGDTTPLLRDNDTGLTANGTNFDASGNTLSLVLGSTVVAQTVNAGESTTAIPFDVVLGALPHTVLADGTTPAAGIGSLVLRVAVASQAVQELDVELAPRTGTQVVALGTSIDQTSASLLQQPAILPGSMTLAENDQIQHDTTTANGHALTVNADGTFSIDGGTGTDSFSYRVWTAADGRTEWITATVGVEGDVVAAPTARRGTARQAARGPALQTALQVVNQ